MPHRRTRPSATTCQQQLRAQQSLTTQGPLQLDETCVDKCQTAALTELLIKHAPYEGWALLLVLHCQLQQGLLQHKVRRRQDAVDLQGAQHLRQLGLQGGARGPCHMLRGVSLWDAEGSSLLHSSSDLLKLGLPGGGRGSCFQLWVCCAEPLGCLCSNHISSKAAGSPKILKGWDKPKRVTGLQHCVIQGW